MNPIGIAKDTSSRATSSFLSIFTVDDFYEVICRLTVGFVIYTSIFYNFSEIKLDHVFSMFSPPNSQLILLLLTVLIILVFLWALSYVTSEFFNFTFNILIKILFKINNLLEKLAVKYPNFPKVDIKHFISSFIPINLLEEKLYTHTTTVNDSINFADNINYLFKSSIKSKLLISKFKPISSEEFLNIISSRLLEKGLLRGQGKRTGTLELFKGLTLSFIIIAVKLAYFRMLNYSFGSVLLAVCMFDSAKRYAESSDNNILFRFYSHVLFKSK